MRSPPAPDSVREFASLARDEWMFGEGVAVLMYHKVSRPLRGTNLPFLYVQPRRLERQLDELLSAGQQCVPYGDLAAVSEEGGKGFCLTFDDGFCNVFDHALPVLVAKQARAIQFIVATQVGGRDVWDHAIGEPPQALMDEAQIREWMAAGQEIGSHTLTHPRLAEIPLADARREIFDSKKMLEDRLGCAVRHFCYPYGSYNEAVRDLVGEAGYASACTVEFGTAQPGRHPLALPRIMATDVPPLWRVAAKRLRRAWCG